MRKITANILLTSMLLIGLIGCGQPVKKEKKSISIGMDKDLLNILKDNIKEYKTKPIYSAQINKSGCRLILEMEAEDYRLVENNGESLMLPLNGLILNSGVQHIRVKVYPKEGETTLSSYARVTLTLYFAPDKDSSLKDYQKIAAFKLPEDIAEQKLPYYEDVITFKAEVPFDYKQELDKVGL